MSVNCTAVCWIHVNVYLKTFKFVEKCAGGYKKMSNQLKNFTTPLQYLHGPPGGHGPPVEDLWSKDTTHFNNNQNESRPYI